LNSRIKTVELPITELEKFLDQNNFIVEIRELIPGGPNKWVASVRKDSVEHCLVEIKDGGMLISRSGYGDTKKEAVDNLVRGISGEVLVTDAFDKEKRREIAVPEKLVYGGEPS
jgi:hypothetical protein